MANFKVGDKVRIKLDSFYSGQGVNGDGSRRIYTIDEVNEGSEHLYSMSVHVGSERQHDNSYREKDVEGCDTKEGAQSDLLGLTMQAN